MHLLVDSTGLKLCGAGEWLIEKQGTHARRSWRKLHIGLNANTGQIVAATLTDRDVDDAAVVVPPRSTAVPSAAAGSAPTQRDRHLQCIVEHGRIGWQKASGYNTRARVEASVARWKQVIGNGLRSRKDERRATESEIAVHALNRMLELGRPISVRIA